MAEILVFNRNNTHPDPKIDAEAMWKLGDVVVVKEDGHPWGKEELTSTFLIVKIPGAPAAKFIEYELPDLDENGFPVAKRLYKLNVDGSKTISEPELLSSIESKRVKLDANNSK